MLTLEWSSLKVYNLRRIFRPAPRLVSSNKNPPSSKALVVKWILLTLEIVDIATTHQYSSFNAFRPQEFRNNLEGLQSVQSDKLHAGPTFDHI